MNGWIGEDEWTKDEQERDAWMVEWLNGEELGRSNGLRNRNTLSDLLDWLQLLLTSGQRNGLGNPQLPLERRRKSGFL